VGEIVVSGNAGVDVRVGDGVLIRLPENATTGYVWSALLAGAGIALVSDEICPADNGAPGAAGERLFRVRAIGVGPAEVVLQPAVCGSPLRSRNAG